MNILITAPSLNPSQNVSGIATVVNTIIRHNKQHHYYHYLLGSPDKQINKLLWIIQLVKQLLLFPIAIKRNSIDLVHQNLPFDPKGVLREYIINIWCRIFGVPVFLHVHGGTFLMNGTENILFKTLSKSLFKHSKQVIVLSNLEKESLKEKFNLVTAKVLCNSIDTNRYTVDNKHIHNKPSLLYLGRIHESKGVEDIIEAFRILKKNTDFQFFLCGTGPMQEYFITACNNLLGNDFKYYGVVSGKEKIDIIHKSDFFLLPSRYGEGMPMALLETMSAGVVPVVTDDASMKYVVQHDVNGICVKKKSPSSIYENLDAVFKNKKRYEELSFNATHSIRDKYDIKPYIIELNKIYNSSIKNK